MVTHIDFERLPIRLTMKRGLRPILSTTAIPINVNMKLKKAVIAAYHIAVQLSLIPDIFIIDAL